jgi:hypothetical protein
MVSVPYPFVVLHQQQASMEQFMMLMIIQPEIMLVNMVMPYQWPMPQLS